MGSGYRSDRARIAARVAVLREQGLNPAEVAHRLADEERASFLTGLRWAHGWTQQQAAREWNRLFPSLGRVMTTSTIGDWEAWPRRHGHQPKLDNLIRLAQLYDCTVDELTTAFTTPTPGAHARQERVAPGAEPSVSLGRLSVAEGAGDDDPMRRREFTAALGVSLFAGTPEVPRGSIFGSPPGASLQEPASAGRLRSGPELRAAVDQAKRDYQACRYRALAARLPGLVAACQAAADHHRDERQRYGLALLAETWHVAASVLLKCDDTALAAIAADRATHAARASGDDLAAGSAARIFTHALLATGHAGEAASWASKAAAAVSTSSPSPSRLSVYGALLLRGAIAAARADDRDAAHTLLDDADQAAQQLGADGNHYWTAFGPTNVLLHRVHIATALGDAGTALAYAQQIAPERVTVPERRASFWIDVARANAQRGRHRQALTALREADACAPEEVRTRPTVRTLVGDLCTRSPQPKLDGLEQFATRIGAIPR